MTARRVWWCQRANGPLIARKVENYIAEAGAQTRVMPVTCQDIDRAGDGNRTRIASLEDQANTSGTVRDVGFYLPVDSLVIGTDRDGCYTMWLQTGAVLGPGHPTDRWL